MPRVTVEARVPARDRVTAFETIKAFDRYPDLTDAVREVSVEERGLDGGISTWEVNFRDGILRWQEEDSFDPAAGRISFELTGDFESFTGEWLVTEDGGAGVRVSFAADFDLGIPSLAQLIDPLAQRTLYHNVAVILEGLFGAGTSILSEEPARDVRRTSTEGTMPALLES
jgi:ribosome-associated toxin RatA of RatAB toxin-antitoxin module